MKTVQFEYGEGYLAAELPDSADVFIPGETVADPPCLEDVTNATREALQKPLGLPSISRSVGPGAKVTISFPDRVKGGFQPNSHRKTAIPLIIEECLKAGVFQEDIRLICSNGLHRKNTNDEIRSLIGDSVYDRFMPAGQIVNHDSEDWENLVDLGKDQLGDDVILNKSVFTSTLPILIGHVLGNPYGGYSGGYKMAATGLTHWRSIASHHIPQVMHRPDFLGGSPYSEMHQRFDAIGTHMEKEMGQKFFMCDAVLDSQSRQIAVFSGAGEEVQPASWQVADRRTFVPFARQPYDIMIFGMPQNFHYGNGHGTNPILIQQAIGANLIRHHHVLSENCVVICASLCNGFFNDAEFTGYRDLYERFVAGGYQGLPDLAASGEEFCSREDFIQQYRYNYGYHPYHGFSMISCGQIAERRSLAVYLVGAQMPGYARAMGMKTCATFTDALADAARYTGPNPHILALPKCFRTPAVHLLMAENPA